MTQDGFKDLHFNLDDQDILIRMQPILDHQNNWTGDVNLQVIDSIANPLSDRDFNEIVGSRFYHEKFLISTINGKKAIVKFDAYKDAMYVSFKDNYYEYILYKFIMLYYCINR